MTIPVHALLSIVIGLACVMSSAVPPFGIDSVFALVVGIANFGMAIVLIRDLRP